MSKNKLVIIFDYDSTLLNVPEVLILDSVEHLKEYFEKHKLINIKLDFENNTFSFNYNNIWDGTGEIYHSKQVIRI